MTTKNESSGSKWPDNSFDVDRVLYELKDEIVRRYGDRKVLFQSLNAIIDAILCTFNPDMVCTSVHVPDRQDLILNPHELQSLIEQIIAETKWENVEFSKEEATELRYWIEEFVEASKDYEREVGQRNYLDNLLEFTVISAANTLVNKSYLLLSAGKTLNYAPIIDPDAVTPRPELKYRDVREAGVSGKVHAEDNQDGSSQSTASKAANKARKENEFEKHAKRHVSPSEEAKSLLARAMAILRKPVEAPLVTRVTPWIQQQTVYKVLHKHLLASRQKIMVTRLFLRTKADAAFASIEKQFKLTTEKSLAGISALRKWLALRYPNNRFGALGIALLLALDATKPVWSPVLRLLAPVGNLGVAAVMAVASPVVGTIVVAGTIITGAGLAVSGGIIATGKLLLKVSRGPAKVVGSTFIFAGNTVGFTFRLVKKGVVTTLQGGLALGSGIIAGAVFTGRSISHGAVSGARLARRLLPSARTTLDTFEEGRNRKWFTRSEDIQVVNAGNTPTLKHLIKHPITGAYIGDHIDEVVHLVTDIWVPVDESGRLRLLDEFLAGHKAVDVYQHLYRFEEIPVDADNYRLSSVLRYTVAVNPGRFTIPFPANGVLLAAFFVKDKEKIESAAGVPIRRCCFGGLDIIIPSGVHAIKITVELAETSEWKIPAQIIKEFNALLPRLGKYELQVESTFAKVLVQSPLSERDKLAVWVARQVFQRRIYMNTAPLMTRLFDHCGQSLLTAVSALRVAPPELLAFYSTGRLNTLELPSVFVSGITAARTSDGSEKFDMRPYFCTSTLIADALRNEEQMHVVDLAAASFVATMENIPWAIKRGLVTEFANRRGEKLLRFANEVHGWVVNDRYPYKVTLTQKVKAALVLPTLKKQLRRRKLNTSDGFVRSIDHRIRSLSNAVFVQAYLLELEKAFEEAFRTENSAPVYDLLLDKLPAADPASLALIRGDANVEIDVRSQIFDFAEVCLSPFSIPLAQQSIKWLLKEKTDGDGWFIRTEGGDDALLCDYVAGGWNLPAEGFTALTSTRIERFIRRIERLELTGEKALLNQIRIWLGAVTTYHLNKGLARKAPRWEIAGSWNGGNSGWNYPNQPNWNYSYEGDNWSWNSFRNMTELTPGRRILQDFVRRIARRFPANQSAASIIELQDMFVQLARLDSGSLGAALLWEAAGETFPSFLNGVTSRYPLDPSEVKTMANEFLVMIRDRYTTQDLEALLGNLAEVGVDIRVIVDQNQVTEALIAGLANPMYARTIGNEHKFNYPSLKTPGSRLLATLRFYNPLIGVYKKAAALKSFGLVNEQALIEAFPKVSEQGVISEILSKLSIPSGCRTLVYNRGLFSGNEDVGDISFHPSIAEKLAASPNMRALLWLLAPRFRKEIVNWDIREAFFSHQLVQDWFESKARKMRNDDDHFSADALLHKPVVECFVSYYSPLEWYDFRLWLAVLHMRGFMLSDEKTNALFEQLVTEQNDSALESVVASSGITTPSSLGIPLPLRSALIMLAAVICEKSQRLTRSYRGVFDIYGLWPLSEESIVQGHINRRATLADLWRMAMRTRESSIDMTWLYSEQFSILRCHHERQQRQSYPALAITPGRAGSYLEDRTFRPDVDDENDICWETSRGTGETLVPVYATTETRDINLIVDVALLSPGYGPYLPGDEPRIGMIWRVIEFCLENRLQLDITVWGRSEVLYCEKVCTPANPFWVDMEALAAIAQCSDESVKTHESTLGLDKQCRYDRLFNSELPRYSKKSVLTMLFSKEHEDEARNLAENLAEGGYLTTVI